VLLHTPRAWPSHRARWALAVEKGGVGVEQWDAESAPPGGHTAMARGRCLPWRRAPAASSLSSGVYAVK